MIKHFTIIENKVSGFVRVGVYYESGCFREFTANSFSELPSTILEACNSGDFVVVKTRECNGLFGQWYDRV